MQQHYCHTVLFKTFEKFKTPFVKLQSDALASVLQLQKQNKSLKLKILKVFHWHGLKDMCTVDIYGLLYTQKCKTLISR